MERIQPKPKEISNNRVIVSANISQELAKKVDAECKRTGMNKAELIRTVLIEYFKTPV